MKRVQSVGFASARALVGMCAVAVAFALLCTYGLAVQRARGLLATTSSPSTSLAATDEAAPGTDEQPEPDEQQEPPAGPDAEDPGAQEPLTVVSPTLAAAGSVAGLSPAVLSALVNPVFGALVGLPPPLGDVAVSSYASVVDMITRGSEIARTAIAGTDGVAQTLSPVVNPLATTAGGMAAQLSDASVTLVGDTATALGHHNSFPSWAATYLAGIAEAFGLTAPPGDPGD